MVAPACGGDSAPPAMVMLPPLSKTVASAMQPADYSCNGHYADPAGATADFTIGGTVKDFQTSSPVPNALVKVYADLPSLMADQPLDMKLAGNDGIYAGLKIPANHYRVNFKVTAPDQLDTYAVGIPIPVGTTTSSRDSVSKITAASLPALVGVVYDGSKAIIAGGVRDCTNSFVQGSIVDITASGQAVPDSSVFYFKFSVPVRKTVQQFTNDDGLWTGINIPPAGMASIEAKGVIGTGATQTIGRTTIPLFAGALTIADIPPLGQ
jgi:hypothetical protein